MKLQRCTKPQGFVRPLIVVFPHKSIKLALLITKIIDRSFDSNGLKVSMHALITAVLLKVNGIRMHKQNPLINEPNSQIR